MTRPSIKLPVFFACFLIILSSCGQEDLAVETRKINPVIEDFEDFLQDEMEDQNIPALSVLVFKEDKVLFENYLGKSHLEQDIDLAKNHPFLLASISKIVTATALMQLEEAGKFDLDDPINDYLDFEVNHPDYSTNITFRMLLTHTSGIADGNAGDDEHYYYGEDSPMALDFFLENFLAPNGDFYDEYENFHDFEPGNTHEYSNIGTALVGVLVEQISAMDFADYCQQHIFNPLGMMDTHWHLEEITGTIVQPYSYINGQFEAIQHYTFTDYPNGGLRSTARDMFQLLSAFTQKGTANNYQLLAPETVADMLSLQVLGGTDDMGLQFFQIDPTNNLWGHDGGEAGVSTIMGFNPMDKIGVLIFTNQEDAELEDILEEAYYLGQAL